MTKNRGTEDIWARFYNMAVSYCMKRYFGESSTDKLCIKTL